MREDSRRGIPAWVWWVALGTALIWIGARVASRRRARLDDSRG